MKGLASFEDEILLSLDTMVSCPVHHPRTERFVELSHPSLVGLADREIHGPHPTRDRIKRLSIAEDVFVLARRRGVKLLGVASQAVNDDNISRLKVSPRPGRAERGIVADNVDLPLYRFKDSLKRACSLVFTIKQDPAYELF